MSQNFSPNHPFAKIKDAYPGGIDFDNLRNKITKNRIEEPKAQILDLEEIKQEKPMYKFNTSREIPKNTRIEIVRHIFAGWNNLSLNEKFGMHPKILNSIGGQWRNRYRREANLFRAPEPPQGARRQFRNTIKRKRNRPIKRTTTPKTDLFPSAKTDWKLRIDGPTGREKNISAEEACNRVMGMNDLTGWQKFQVIKEITR